MKNFVHVISCHHVTQHSPSWHFVCERKRLQAVTKAVTSGDNERNSHNFLAQVDVRWQRLDWTYWTILNQIPV